jgi:pimeloyl-ACP methyl ester carboxylesterase
MKSMRDPAQVRMDRRLLEHFDVLAFDLRGHGDSPGATDLNFATAADDLQAVLEHARSLDYARIGVIGYSYGAAAAIVAAANGAPIDAVAAVSCPASPTTTGARMLAHVTGSAPHRLWARIMGTRIAETLEAGPWPIHLVRRLNPTPVLVVHCAWDTLIPRRMSESLFAVANAPKQFLLAPRALHASPYTVFDEIIAWFDQQLSAT